MALQLQFREKLLPLSFRPYKLILFLDIFLQVCTCRLSAGVYAATCVGYSVWRMSHTHMHTHTHTHTPVDTSQGMAGASCGPQMRPLTDSSSLWPSSPQFIASPSLSLTSSPLFTLMDSMSYFPATLDCCIIKCQKTVAHHLDRMYYLWQTEHFVWKLWLMCSVCAFALMEILRTIGWLQTHVAKSVSMRISNQSLNFNCWKAVPSSCLCFSFSTVYHI